jgi:hypothetical protein
LLKRGLTPIKLVNKSGSEIGLLKYLGAVGNSHDDLQKPPTAMDLDCYRRKLLNDRNGDSYE